jgi:glycosyltransferase involved in cell wall biosynthesis
MGHEVIFITNRHTNDGPILRWEGITVYPGGIGHGMQDAFGWQGAYELCSKWKPQILFSIFDIWTFPIDFGEQLHKLGTTWIPICPVDHDPIPPVVYRVLQGSPLPAAMSKYGQQKMIEAGIKDPLYMPHGVETAIYRPIPVKETREKISGGHSENFIVGIVAANRATYDRKSFNEQIQMYSLFHETHPDTSLYLHMHVDGYESGFDVAGMVDLYGKFPYYKPSRWSILEGYDDEDMATIFNSFDVHMLCSRGEGFGIPTVEAQACGVPVIVTDFAASPELCGSGWKVPASGKVMTEQHACQVMPDVKSGAAALGMAYDMWKNNKVEWMRMKHRARLFALQYDEDRLFAKHIVPVLEKIEGGYRPMPQSTLANAPAVG